MHLLPDTLTIGQHFDERTLSPGVDVSMQCTTISNYPHSFIWKQDGRVVTSNTNQRYTLGQLMVENGVIGHLNISRTRVEDGGLYTCEATSSSNISVSHSSRLNIFGPPYVRDLGVIQVLSGGVIEFSCPYYGYPISEISWKTNGNIIETIQSRFRRNDNRDREDISNVFIVNYLKDTIHRKKRRAKMIDGGILRIENIDSGYNKAVYTCTVKNPSGEMARRDFEIEVLEPPVLDDMSFSPNLKEGENAQIMCTLRSGDNPVFFSWYKDGSSIAVSLKVEERSSDLFSVLVIRKVSLEHCGTYTCLASNHAGKVNKTADLYIKVAPKWLEEPRNVSFLQGNSAHVICTASGYPQPQVHWMKKNHLSGIWQPVLDIIGRGILSLPNGSLVIDSASPEDEGFYSCHVENGVGSPLSKAIWMKINIPVSFEHIPTNVTSRLGHAISLSCSAYGDRPIHISWSRNGAPIEQLPKRFKITETFNDKTVTSTAVTQYSELRDSGSYQCKASNPHGIAVFKLHLYIQEPPSSPTDILIDDIRSRHARVSWKGDSMIDYIYSIQYTIQKHYVTSWEKSHVKNVTSKYSDSRNFVDLYDLLPATSYSVRVSAGNSVERSAFSNPITFTTMEEEPSLPPSHVAAEQTLNPGELKISWMPPPKESSNGEILGYYITVTPKVDNISDSNIKTIKVLSRSHAGNTQMETIVSNLLKSTRYSITIKIYNSAGIGPSSIAVYKETKEGAPESAPSSIECHAISSTSLLVKWREIPLVEQGGALLGFNVLYSTEGGPWLNLTTLHTELSLHRLSKYTNYSVKVSGYSNYGIGPYSQITICQTAQDVPGPPSDIKVLTTTSTSLIVSWRKPFQANGIIEHYSIYIKSTISSNHPISYRIAVPVNDSTLWQEVRSLSQDTRYEVWVTASTSVGEGESSKKVYTTLSGRVLAGVYSLGGSVSTGVGGSMLLPCQAIGSPQPRTVWYHNQNIITHHPRYTLNDDNSLFIDKIDQSLSGNYTCLAKNLFGSDSVSYSVNVVPLPDPPIISTFPTTNSITLEWSQASQYSSLDHGRVIITDYQLTWKEKNPLWSDDWSNHGKVSNNEVVLSAKTVRELNNLYVINGLKCGTTYVLSMMSVTRNGNSQPSTIEVNTLGGEPIPPKTTDWFWSNSSHVLIQLSGWEENGCEIQSWLVDYRQFYTKLWLRAENKLVFLELPMGWNRAADHSFGLRSKANTFVIGNLPPGQWYQFRVKSSSEAGPATAHYTYATKTIMGDEIDPPYDYFDMSVTVIVCSTALLFLCVVACIVATIRRKRHVALCSDSAYKSETVNVMSVAASRDTLDIRERQDNSRLYSSPINVKKPYKGEGFEISPYAQFRMDFRTFGNMDNQARPSLDRDKNGRYNAETSFQDISESEDSDSISKTMTLKQIPPRKGPKMR